MRTMDDTKYISTGCLITRNCSYEEALALVKSKLLLSLRREKCIAISDYEVKMVPSPNGKDYVRASLKVEGY